MTLWVVSTTFGYFDTVTVTNANRQDPRLRSVLDALRRVIQRPAHAAPRTPARPLLWWVGGLGALVLLGSWIGAAGMSTSGHRQLADPPRSVDSIAVPGVSAEPTPTASASGEPGATDSADCGAGTSCEARSVGAGTRGPRPGGPGKPGRKDPKYHTCAEAKARGYGPYVRGESPEYVWYRREDTDNDGVVCA